MKTRRLVAAAALLLAALLSGPASAHCDTLDGPVVKAAQRSLETGNLAPALVWVRRKDEKELRAAFDKALAVRKGGGAARDLADMYFFETLVRIHRVGEGAPYTGLKPAGEVEPAIAMADRAVLSGKPDEVERVVGERMRAGLHKQFEKLMARRKYEPNDIEAGRAFSNAYVEYIHYVERLYHAAESLAPEGSEGHKH